MGAQSCAPRTCEKGWLCQTFSKRCATKNKYTIWVFVLGKYYNNPLPIDQTSGTG